MKRFLPLALLVSLLLAGCGTPSTQSTDGSLGSSLNTDSSAEDTGSTDTVNPDDVPYSAGPTEIPSDLVRHD